MTAQDFLYQYCRRAGPEQCGLARACEERAPAVEDRIHKDSVLVQLQIFVTQKGLKSSITAPVEKVFWHEF